MSEVLPGAIPRTTPKGSAKALPPLKVRADQSADEADVEQANLEQVPQEIQRRSGHKVKGICMAFSIIGFLIFLLFMILCSFPLFGYNGDDNECSAELYQTTSDDVLLILTSLDQCAAAKERLVREVMRVDKTVWNDANVVVTSMEEEIGSNGGAYFIYYLGSILGIVGSFFAVVVSFDLGTALWFNAKFVTAEIPPKEDLDTFYEVGKWTGEWFGGPVLGVLSFFLLGLQFAQPMLAELGMYTYSEIVISNQASAFADKFAQYDRKALRDFAKLMLVD